MNRRMLAGLLLLLAGVNAHAQLVCFDRDRAWREAHENRGTVLVFQGVLDPAARPGIRMYLLLDPDGKFTVMADHPVAEGRVCLLGLGKEGAVLEEGWTPPPAGEDAPASGGMGPKIGA